MSTVAELKKKCDTLSIAYGKRAKKADLIKILEDHEMTTNIQTPVLEKKMPVDVQISAADVSEEKTSTDIETPAPDVPGKKRGVREIAGPIFNKMADAGATRPEIIDALMELTGKSKNYVSLQYNMLADFFGKHPRSGEYVPRGKKAIAFEIFGKYITEGMEEDALENARKTATIEVLKATELKKASVDMHLRAYLEMKGYQVKKRSRAEHREPCWNWFKENLDTKREDAIKQFVTIGVSTAVASSYWSTFSLAKELFEDLVDVEEEEPQQAEAA